MQHSTRGIVLHQVNYSESSIVAKIYTELFGLQSYIINSVRGKKSKFKSNIFQPLSLVEMIVYHKENRGLQRLSEIRCNPQLNNISSDIRKSSITIFLNEVLIKVLKEEEHDQSLFDFLFHAIQILDLTTDSCSNFHLQFLVSLSRFAGFYPLGTYNESDRYFDMMEGKFVPLVSGHPHVISDPYCKAFYNLTISSFKKNEEIKINHYERKILLTALLDYYRLHISNFGIIRSQHILEEVLA
ncbi:MAG: DNA repair protein RecO [Bacteroidia bacterium]